MIPPLIRKECRFLEFAARELILAADFILIRRLLVCVTRIPRAINIESSCSQLVSKKFVEIHRAKVFQFQASSYKNFLNRETLKKVFPTLLVQVRYTGYRDRPVEERQVRFQNGCREGYTEIAFAATGTNLQLVFGNASGNYASDINDCDFEKERGKVGARLKLLVRSYGFKQQRTKVHP